MSIKLTETEVRLLNQVVESVRNGARLDDSIKFALRGIIDGARRSYLWNLLKQEFPKKLKGKEVSVPAPKPIITPLMRMEAYLRTLADPPSSR